MSRKNLIIIIIFTILSLLWCCWPLLIARGEAAETIPNRQNYISVPIAQWERLKSNTKMLDANLTLLQDSLTAQEQRSAELTNLLQQAKNELQKTQTALQNADASLQSVEKSLKVANELCVTLRKQIEQERQAATAAKEKAYWKGWLNGFCCGLVGGVLAVVRK